MKILIFVVMALSTNSLIMRTVKQKSGKCNPTQGNWQRNIHPDHIKTYTLGEQAGDALRKFTPTPAMPLPEFMMWDWMPSDGCNLATMNHVSFCGVMAKLNLTHFTIIGDSTNFMMAQSLWKLVEEEGEPVQMGLLKQEHSEFEATTENMAFQKSISCPTGAITFSYTRNDRLDARKTSGKCETNEKGADRCYPWWDNYIEHAANTMLVANAGVHYHESLAFREVFDKFNAQLSLAPPGMLVFRLSVPGHADCQKYERPFEKPEDFHESTKYNWDLVPHYNAYVTEKLQQKLNTVLLDVYQMSILRPDGHRAPHDCLHYYLPGVPDWWNHLLVTELQKLE